ncbi:MAG: hypothetical protein ACRENE_19010, partial [Polyangiaceae bacterium]
MLGVAAFYLGLRWDDIPPTWTTHWDIAGRPNGWARHDVAGVFGPLAIGALMLAFMEGIGRVARVRRSAGAYALEGVRDATLSFVRTMALGLSLVFALLAVDLPLGPRVPNALLGAVLFALMMGALAVGTVRMSSAFAEARRAGHGAAVEGWHSFYYANRNDGAQAQRPGMDGQLREPLVVARDGADRGRSPRVGRRRRDRFSLTALASPRWPTRPSWPRPPAPPGAEPTP